jgi:hypothetical protein
VARAARLGHDVLHLGSSIPGVRLVTWSILAVRVRVRVRVSSLLTPLSYVDTACQVRHTVFALQNNVVKSDAPALTACSTASV